MRHRVLMRVLDLLRWMEAHPCGFTLDDAAAALRVSPRTIRRDLQALEHVGLRVEWPEQGDSRMFVKWPLRTPRFVDLGATA